MLPERKIVYRPFLQSQDEEEELEGGIFDNLDEPTYLEKRDTNLLHQDYNLDSQDQDPEQRIARQNNYDYSNDYNNQVDYENENQFSNIDRGKREKEVSEIQEGLVRNKMRNNVNDAKLEIEDDSANEIERDFLGELPQNYQEGELNRYKRVKRTDYDDVNKMNN